MKTSSRPRQRSLGETERQPLFVTGSSSVENDTLGARAAPTSGSKEPDLNRKPRKDGSKQSSANRKPRRGGSATRRHTHGGGRGVNSGFTFSPYASMMVGSPSPKPRRASVPGERGPRATAMKSSPEKKMKEDEIDGPTLEQCLVLPEGVDLESLGAALVSSSRARSRSKSEGRDATETRRTVDIDDERAIISSYNYDAIAKKTVPVTQAAGEDTASVEATVRRDHIGAMVCDLPATLDTSDANHAGKGGDSSEPIIQASARNISINASESMDFKDVSGQITLPSTVDDDSIALEGVEEVSTGQAAAAGISGELELDDMVAIQPLIVDSCEAIQEVVGMDSRAEVAVAETLASMEEIVAVPSRETGIGGGSTMVEDDESDEMVAGTRSEKGPTVKSAEETLEWPGPSLIILEEDTEDVGVSAEGGTEEYASGWLEKHNGVHCISCAMDDAADSARIVPANGDRENQVVPPNLAISTVEGASTLLSEDLPIVTDKEIQGEVQTLPEVDVKAGGVEKEVAVDGGQEEVGEEPMEEEDEQEVEPEDEIQIEAEELDAKEKREDSHKLGDVKRDQRLVREGRVPERPLVDFAFAQMADGFDGNAERAGTKMVVESDDDAMPVPTEGTSAVAVADEAAQCVGQGETNGDVVQEPSGERMMDWEALALEMEEEWVLGSRPNEASAVNPQGPTGSEVRGESEADVSSPHVASNTALIDFNLSGFDGSGTAGKAKNAECDDSALLPIVGDGFAVTDSLSTSPAAAETGDLTGGGPESVVSEVREDRKESSEVSLRSDGALIDACDQMHHGKDGVRSAYVMSSICPNQNVHPAEGVYYEPGGQKSLNNESVATPGVGTHHVSDRISPVQRGASIRLVQSEGMIPDGPDKKRPVEAEPEQSEPMSQGRESKVYGDSDGSCECCVVM